MQSPKTLLAAYNLRPQKLLGQNFLADPSTAEMIVNRSGISPRDIVLEIGAGLGALTIPLARIAQKVYAVEIDARISAVLKTRVAQKNLSNVDFIDQNILEYDIQALSDRIRRKIVVAGNLPYNISSQILVQLVNSRAGIDRAVLMFQKELAQRITAQPSCKDYGRLTVMLRYCCDIDSIAEVKAALFFPKPKVDSKVLQVRFHDPPRHAVYDEDFFFKVIKAGFGNRRKTLKNALAASELKIDAVKAKSVLESSGVDPVRRAETLKVEEFVRLSNNLFGAIG